MIYLDSAATTLQKPPQVARAVARAVGSMATPGRGGHQAARLAAETAFRCRQAAADLFGMTDPERVVFTFNATHGLNIAIRSLVPPGGRAVISGFEHNAVTRPLSALGAHVRAVSGPLFRPEAFLEELDRALWSERPDAVICTHVSNVFGYVLPVDQAADLCRNRGVPLVVDASQSAGALPVTPETWGAAYVAMPGHKGLFGPQGTGLLLCGRTDAVPLLCGGTGSQSRLQDMPDFLPDRLEAGTQNIAGVAGLLEGLRYVRRTGTGCILARERRLIGRLIRSLRDVSGVELFTATRPEDQSGVLSLRLRGMDCETAGERLARQGIAVRTGLHCAPLAHQSAGTLESGTVRLSFSPFNTEGELAAAARAITALA